jgi:hypothetical protein
MNRYDILSSRIDTQPGNGRKTPNIKYICCFHCQVRLTDGLDLVLASEAI